MAKTNAKPAAKPVAKKTEAPVAKKAPAFAREMDMKFGIGDLAKALDLDETYTRAKLRNHGVEKKAKGGTAYGWNSRADLDEVVKLLQSGGAKAKTAPANKNDKGADKKKAASAQKTPVGMPKGTGKDKAVVPVKGSPHAPKDGAIKKVAKDVAAGKKALGKK